MKQTLLGLIMFTVFLKAYAESIPSYDFNTGQLHLPQVRVFSSTGETIGLFEAYLEAVNKEPIDFRIKSAESVPHDVLINEQMAHRFVDILNSGEIDDLDEIFASEVVIHSMSSLPFGEEITELVAFKQFFNLLRGALSDSEATVDDVIVDGDKVALRWTIKGTHTDDLPNLPASHVSMTTSGVGIFRFEDYKIVEFWRVFDTLGMMSQLGATNEVVIDKSLNKKQLVNRFVIEVLNEGQMEAADEIFSPNITMHVIDSLINEDYIGLEDSKQFINLYRDSFDGFNVTIDDIIAEGDKVVVQTTTTGVYVGDLFDLPSTELSMIGVGIFLIEADKITELRYMGTPPVIME